jgi:spermidine synthase
VNRTFIQKEPLLLFLVGACLSISQFVMIRDFVTILYGEEVVIILVTAAFFLGLSIGYFLSLKFSEKFFHNSFLVIVFLHLTFPFSYRMLAAEIARLDLHGYVYVVLMFIYALIFSSIFAVFLPRLVHEKSSDKESALQKMKVLYSMELIGFAAGFAIVGMSWNKGVDFILPIYWALLAVIIHLALQKKTWTIAFVLLALVSSNFIEQVDRRTTALLYEYKHHFDEAETLLTINSAYQKVEVIKDEDGELYLYLDGLLNLNASDLEDLNYYIAETPARLIKPEKTLIVGNGTLSSVPKVYPHSKFVQSVELDAGVLLAGQKFFTPTEELKGLDRWNLIIDDGKHFLKTTVHMFDLIIMDIPSPLTIQEAILHTKEFYQLAKSRLTAKGVIAVQLSGPLQHNNRTPARVVAALSEVFDEVMVINSDKADRSFGFAARQLPFNGADVRQATQSYEKGLEIIFPDDISSYLSEAVPLALDNLDLVLCRGLDRFTDRYFDVDRDPCRKVRDWTEEYLDD